MILGVRRFLLGAGVIVGAIALTLWFAREVPQDAPLPPALSGSPTTDASVAPPPDAARTPVLEEASNPRSVEIPTATDEDPYGVVVSVRDWRGEPLPFARVLVADRELARLASIGELIDGGDDRPFAFDGTTGTDGNVRFRYLARSTYHLRVEGPDGLAANPPPPFTAPNGGTVRVAVALGRIFGAAFRLDDRSDAVAARAELAGSAGMWTNRASHPWQFRQRLAARLGLPTDCVFVDVPTDGVDAAREGTVAVYHAQVGWFRAPLTWKPLEQVEATLVAVPEKGVRPPVRVTFECVDAREQPFPVASIRLTGSTASEDFPLLSLQFTSGEPGFASPGRHLINFGQMLVHTACESPRELDLKADTTVRLYFAWPIVETMLVLTRRGRPYRGAVTVDVVADTGRGSHRANPKFLPEGRLSLALRADCRNTVKVTIRGETQAVTFRAGGVTPECHLVF